MRFYLSIIIVSGLFIFSSAAIDTPLPAEAKKVKAAGNNKQISESEEKLLLINNILPGLAQILTLTKNEGRLCAPQLTQEQKYFLLRQLVRNLNPFMDLKEARPLTPPKVKVQGFPMLSLKRDKVLYFRIDSFATENIKYFLNDTKKLINSKKLPDGIILDLRNCTGFHNENMCRVFQRCSGSAKYFSRNNAAGKALELTTVCLISNRTSGAAELLTRAVALSPDGITVGRSTAGHPFNRETVELKSGFFLLIPQIPEFIKKLPPKPVRPTVLCQGKYQEKYTALEQHKASGKDACLNVAVDLLSIVNKIR